MDLILKLLNDFNSAWNELANYFGNGRLFESNNQRKLFQESLVPTFIEKIESIKHDIKVIENNIDKLSFKEVDERNNELVSLAYNIMAVNSAFNKSIKKDYDAAEYRKDLMGLIPRLKEIIVNYNIRAKKYHKKQLYTLSNAQEKAKELFLSSPNIEDWVKDN